VDCAGRGMRGLGGDKLGGYFVIKEGREGGKGWILEDD
jgi:hypothetical protein